MRRIEIDDEVYDLLESYVIGFEQPNDVLRRVLRISAQQPVSALAAVPDPSYQPGKLAPLIQRGLIKAGDTLVHRQVRRGNTYNALVEPDGWIRTDKKRYKAPSPALVDLVGSSIDGWANWTHVQSGKTLRQLREDGSGPQ